MAFMALIARGTCSPHSLWCWALSRRTSGRVTKPWEGWSLASWRPRRFSFAKLSAWLLWGFRQDAVASYCNLPFTSSQVGSRTAYPQVLVATDVAARGLDIKGVPDPATSSYCSSDVHCGETWRRLGWWSTMMQPTTPRLPAQRKLSLAALRDTPSVLSRLWNMHDILQ